MFIALTRAEKGETDGLPIHLRASAIIAFGPYKEHTWVSLQSDEAVYAVKESCEELRKLIHGATWVQNVQP